jgi:hypothetical protein
MAIVRKIRPGLGQIDWPTTDFVDLPAEQPVGTPEVSIYGLPASTTPDTTGALWPPEVPPITPILPGITPGTVMSTYTPQSDATVYTPAPSFWDTLLSTATKLATQAAGPKPVAGAPSRPGTGLLPAGSRPVAAGLTGGFSPVMLAAIVIGVALVTQKRGRRR